MTGSFAHASILVCRASCHAAAAAAAAFSHPFLFLTWLLQHVVCPALLLLRSWLPARNDCSPHAPRLIGYLPLPMGSRPLWSANQLYHGVVVQRLFDAKLLPSLLAPCSSQSGTGTAQQNSCKSVSALSGSSMICGNFQWLLSVLIPPWRAIINPTISDAPSSGRFVFCLRIFVSEKPLPIIFMFCHALNPKYFLNAGGA